MTKDEDPLLQNVIERSAAWKKLWRFWIGVHYAAGICGALASTIAAASKDTTSQVAAAISTVCFGIIGFAKPEEKYLRYVRAWRIADSAIRRFRFGSASADFLMRAVENGEQILQELERDKENKEEEVRKMP